MGSKLGQKIFGKFAKINLPTSTKQNKVGFALFLPISTVNPLYGHLILTFGFVEQERSLLLGEDINNKTTFSFEHCPNHLNTTWSSFLDVKNGVLRV